MRTIIVPTAPIAALCLILSAAPARAESNRHELWIGGSARALRSPSANALTDANLSGSSLGYAHDLGISLVPGSAIWLEAGVTTGAADGTMFKTMTTELTTLDLTGGLRARYALHRLIVASARLDLGAQRVRVNISDPSTSGSDHSWGPIASVGTALDVFAKASAPFGIGMRVELGYVVAPGLSLTPHRPVADDDVIMLPRTDFALGKLDLGGPSFTVSLLGQF